MIHPTDFSERYLIRSIPTNMTLAALCGLAAGPTGVAELPHPDGDSHAASRCPLSKNAVPW
jgi:hypothetical protein